MIGEKTAALLMLLMLAAPASAQNAPPAGAYPAKVMRVIDADTLRARVKIWPAIEILATVRLRGVNTPEKGYRAKCEEERRAGERSTGFVRDMLPKGAKIYLRRVRLGKYAGRVLADVYLGDGRKLADILIARGLGRPYHGGRRKSWCWPKSVGKESRLK